MTFLVADTGRAWVSVVAALGHIAVKGPQIRIHWEGKKSKIKHEKQRSAQSLDNAAFTLWCGRPSHRWQKLTLVPYNSCFVIGVMPSISEAGICVASLTSTLWEQVCCTTLILQKSKNSWKGRTSLNNLVKCM